MAGSRRPSRMSEDELSQAIGTGRYAKGKEPSAKSLEKVGPDKDRKPSEEPNKAGWKEKIRSGARRVGSAASRFNDVVQERHKHSSVLGRDTERREKRREGERVKKAKYIKRRQAPTRIDRYENGALIESIHYDTTAHKPMAKIPAKRPRIQAPPQEREERGSWGISGFDSVGFMESMEPPNMDMSFSGFGLNSQKKGKRNDYQFDYLDYVSRSPFR